MKFGRLGSLGAFLALAALGGSVSPRSAQGFIFLSGGGFAKGERPVAAVPVWPTRTLRFYVNTNLSALGGSTALTITGAELLLAAESAVGAWSQACRADLRIEIAGTTNSVYDSSDGVNTIVWDRRTEAEGNYYGNKVETLAAATSVVAGDDFVDCDIVMNGNASTTMRYSPSAGQADLRSVVTHEIGHCFGLDHPIEPNTMTPSQGYDSAEPFLRGATMVQTVTLGDPSDTSRRDINQDDRDGLECVYERGRPFRTGGGCASYTGTNGQGTIVGDTSIVGGPDAVDTNCGTDAQGRTARPSVARGDGCIGSAFAQADGSPETNGYASLLDRIGGSFGFWLAIGFALLYRRTRRQIHERRLARRSLRGVASLAILVAIALTVPLAREARAWELELHYSRRNPSPRLWESFAGMASSGAVWDRPPNAVDFGGLSELSASAFSEFETWGKWGAYLAVSLPKTLASNGKALNAADQTKRTSLGGLRVGPELRWYPLGEDGLRWFVGGRFGAGVFFGSQELESSAGAASSGKVSYRAWAIELAASTGLEVPVGPVSLVADVGYSRLRSSYFASTGYEGSVYSDFASGERLGVDDGAEGADLKFLGSGVYARLGVQIALGGGAKKSTRDTPAYDDYEGSPSREETRPADAKPESETVQTKDRAAEPDPTATPRTGTTPLPPPPAEETAPAPTPSPLADPMQDEREFQRTVRPVPSATPAPRPTPTPSKTPKAPALAPITRPTVVPTPPPPPLVPRKRESWEIDPIPEPSALDGTPTSSDVVRPPAGPDPVP